MSDICFYFQIHQPDRLNQNYSIADIGKNPLYLDEEANKEIFLKVARKSYLPTVKVLKDLVVNTQGQFKCTLSFSGVFLEQAQRFCPEVLEAFVDLYKTGQQYYNAVEILGETYYHSLAFLYSPDEWYAQIKEHNQLIQSLFGAQPQIFRNTELIYNNWIGERIADLGYKAILAEGVDSNLGWRSPNYIYNHPNNNNFQIFLKNYKLADDIAFRFSNKSWEEWPLTVEKYMTWLNRAGLRGYMINLFMDFETFGEHQWEETGIFDFLYHFGITVANSPDHGFITPSVALDKYKDYYANNTEQTYNADNLTSWADEERDLSAWKSNALQDDALMSIYQLEADLKKIKNNDDLLKIWRRLTTSDHFYYMCTKYYADGDVHQYFSPFDSPYNAYITYKNVLCDLACRIKELNAPKPRKTVHVLSQQSKTNITIDKLEKSPTTLVEPEDSQAVT